MAWLYTNASGELIANSSGELISGADANDCCCPTCDDPCTGCYYVKDCTTEEEFEIPCADVCIVPSVGDVLRIDEECFEVESVGVACGSRTSMSGADAEVLPDCDACYACYKILLCSFDYTSCCFNESYTPGPARFCHPSLTDSDIDSIVKINGYCYTIIEATTDTSLPWFESDDVQKGVGDCETCPETAGELSPCASGTLPDTATVIFGTAHTAFLCDELDGTYVMGPTEKSDLGGYTDCDHRWVKNYSEPTPGGGTAFLDVEVEIHYGDGVCSNCTVVTVVVTTRLLGGSATTCEWTLRMPTPCEQYQCKGAFTLTGDYIGTKCSCFGDFSGLPEITVIFS